MPSHVFEEPLVSIYQIVTFSSICLTHFFSLVFLLVKTPKTSALHTYQQTKYILAAAYMLVAVFNSVELLFANWFANGHLVLLNTVTLSSLELFLVSASLIMLINTHYFNIRLFIGELVPIIGLSIFGYVMLYSGSSNGFKLLLGIYIVYFASQCIRYSLRFTKEKARTMHEINNYFSADSNSKKLRWITQTYITIIIMGVFAILSCIKPDVFMVPFSFLYLAFFFFLGIKHLNYVYYFHEYETIITAPVQAANSISQNNHSISWEHLENAIEQWEKSGYFTESGLTIEQVATQLSTNRTYLSNYVNQIKQQSFKEWITQLRLEEAKRLLLEKPTLHVWEIGVIVGLPDKSNFGRLFTRNTGVSPQTWRKQQLT